MTPRLLVALMLAGQIFALLPALAFPALVPQFSALWSLSATEAGWVVASYFFGYLLLLPLVMPLTDRRDGRVFVIGGSALSALATLVFPLFADGFGSALVLRFIAGAMHGIFYAPTMRALADRLEEPLRTKALTLYTGNYSLGAGTSFAVAGLVEQDWGWQAAYYVIGCGALVATLLFALALRPKPPVAQAVRRHPLDYRPAFRNRRAFAWILSNMGHSIEFSTMRNWLVALFAMELAVHGRGEVFGLTPPWFAALIALLSLPAVLLGGTMERRLGGERAMLTLMGVTLALSAGMGASILAGAPLWLFVVLAAAYSMMISSDAPIMIQGGMRAAQPGELGTIMAAQTAMSFLVSIPAPILFGMVVDLAGGAREPLGWGIGYTIASLLALGSGVIAVRLLRSQRDQTGQRPRT
jgi:MFS family permease